MLSVFFMLEQETFRLGFMIIIFFTFLNGYLYTTFQHRVKLFPYILGINAVSFIFSVIYILNHDNLQFFPRWLAVVVLGLLYNSKYLNIYVRKKPFVKIFYVGLVWALTNAWVIMPEFEWHLFFINFFFASGLVLPFDIRDMDEDNIVTFPRVYGIQKAKFIAYLFFLIAGIVACFTLKFNFALAFLINLVLAFILVFFTDKNKPQLYFSFGLDALCGLPLVFYWLFLLF